MPPPLLEPEPAGDPWHQALVFALLGERHPELGVQPAPDLDGLERWLRDRDGSAAARAVAGSRRAAGEPWPFPVPDDLAVAPAQLAAAVYAVRTRLGLLGAPAAPAPARALSADEQRLLRDVPPHHG